MLLEIWEALLSGLLPHPILRSMQPTVFGFPMTDGHMEL